MTILYPPPSDVEDLPVEVKEAYNETFPIKAHDPATFVVRVGILLDAVCTEQGVSSNKNLGLRLRKLSERLPNTFAGMINHLRELRNRGSHESAASVHASDADVAATFMEAILDHLYRYPAKVRRVTDMWSKE